MPFKLLCTLCALVASNSLNHHIPIKTENDKIIQINSNIGSVVTHNLCDDFTPNITNTTCHKMLFVPSEELDFITITNQTMQLIPTANDGACYIKNVFLCFSKTYQLTIHALNATDHALMLDKMFTVTVEGNDKYDTETIIIILVLLGSGVTYACSSCIQNSLKDLFRYRRQMREERGRPERN